MTVAVATSDSTLIPYIVWSQSFIWKADKWDKYSDIRPDNSYISDRPNCETIIIIEGAFFFFCCCCRRRSTSCLHEILLSANKNIYLANVGWTKMSKDAFTRDLLPRGAL